MSARAARCESEAGRPALRAHDLPSDATAASASKFTRGRQRNKRDSTNSKLLSVKRPTAPIGRNHQFELKQLARK